MANKVTYYQRGDAIDYSNSGNDTIKAGTVVSLATRVGIAGADIEAGETGAVVVEGVYSIAKDDAAITLGAAVYYSPTDDTVSATEQEDGIEIGYATAAALATDTVAYVKLKG